MAYSILAINPSHNGSAALVVDGELVYYCEEERVSRMKYDGNPFRAMLQILMSQPVDELILGGTMQDSLPKMAWTGEDPFTGLARKFNPNIKVTNLSNLHHLGHAAAAFYGSGFESAAAVIIDGAGSIHQEQLGENGPVVAGYETESIYHCSYPNEFNALYKRYSDGGLTSNSMHYDNGIQEFDPSVTITKSYEAVSDYLGFTFIEGGKTMGLAPYGVEDENIPEFFVQGKGNKNLLMPFYPAGSRIDEDRFPYLKRFTDPREWHNDFSLVRDVDKNLAYKVQKDTEEQVFNLIQKAIDITGETNIVIAGGYGLNCVANYKYLKQFPDVKFFVDPISHDGGTAIGLAKYAWHVHSGDIESKPLKSVYLGTPPDYNNLNVIEENVKEVEIVDITKEEIVDLIMDGNIVSMFQGSSEGGPRALGNRSILFDPRVKDGKDIVNGVKRREWFRPFAGTVMEEHAKEWFDMATLDSSPYMMYAVDVWPEKVELIPSVTHVDNTCRVQTVNLEQNKHYYELIDVFYQKTGVPVLFNTSFNLGGEPLVETLFDAVSTILRCDIQYLYLPEVDKLIKKL